MGLEKKAKEDNCPKVTYCLDRLGNGKIKVVRLQQLESNGALYEFCEYIDKDSLEIRRMYGFN